ncbi:MAG: homoserine dehydrogenase [Verrucomicrobiae bacterium]|nr:homoserine dehydrogenase [Verrucomicrobiae bacterium]
MIKSIGIALAGFGTVGAGVFDYLQHQSDLLAERSGFRFDVRSIVVRDLKKNRDVAPPSSLFTTSWRDLLKDPEIKIIVELLGGTTDAFDLIKAAIESGRMVVTGNKALLAEHGQEIFALAKKHDVPIFYEAAVAGGIPIIQSLRDAFVGNRIESIHGILNGTSNYILSRMQEAGLDYKAALAEAAELGYAEADPTFDVNGGDAAHKAIILAALAYGFWVKLEAIRVDGIEAVTAADIFFARNLGYNIKLLATIRSAADDSIEVTVAPTLISKNSVLASVNGVFNAIAVKGDLVGDALFYGRGAGRKPTASSVIGDLVEAAFALKSEKIHGNGRDKGKINFSFHSLYGTSRAAADICSCYYLRLTVEDQPGVLGKIATLLGDAEIGIASAIQPESLEGSEASLVFMTHQASYGMISLALEKIQKLSCVKSKPVVFNVEAV